jgi:hypothetical protein
MDENEEYLSKSVEPSCYGNKDIPDANTVNSSIDFRVIGRIFCDRRVVGTYGALDTESRVCKVPEHRNRW